MKNDSKPGSSDEGWAMVGFLDKEDNPRPGKLMGSKKWAAVYMASTPEQAAALGLDLPGVDCVSSCISCKYVHAEIIHEVCLWELPTKGGMPHQHHYYYLKSFILYALQN